MIFSENRYPLFRIMREMPANILQWFGQRRKRPRAGGRRAATVGGAIGNKKAPADAGALMD
jgi:hypothetical protein